MISFKEWSVARRKHGKISRPVYQPRNKRLTRLAQKTIDRRNPCAYCLEKAVDLVDNTIYLIEDQKYLNKSDFIVALENLKNDIMNLGE